MFSPNHSCPFLRHVHTLLTKLTILTNSIPRIINTKHNLVKSLCHWKHGLTMHWVALHLVHLSFVWKCTAVTHVILQQYATTVQCKTTAHVRHYIISNHKAFEAHRKLRQWPSQGQGQGQGRGSGWKHEGYRSLRAADVMRGRYCVHQRQRSADDRT